MRLSFALTALGVLLLAPTLALAAEPSMPAPAGDGTILRHVLLALAAVVVVGRLMGRLFVYLGQPPVIGEVVGGILLGPSLLGRISPEAYEYLLPPTVAPYLGVIAQLGVVLFMFLVGLELNSGHLRGRARATIAISQAGIVVPFALGLGLAAALYSRLSSSAVPFTSFALFLGVAMSITAFPVLARILTDRRMSKTELGVTALTCAAAGDVTAWCLLAVVVGVAKADPQSGVLVVGGALGYLVVMLLGVRPLLVRLAARSGDDPPSQGTIALVLAGLLLSALATAFIGVHALFGAFLYGAMIPHDSALARALTQKMHDLVTVLLLPAFFAFTGMRTQLGLLSGGEEWLICAAIILVATAGKFGGVLFAGRATGMGWRDAAALGVLMNTRGLMELIVLNIGLDLGVISPTLFAMMVMMALATTLATTPILQLLAVVPKAPGVPTGEAASFAETSSRLDEALPRGGSP